jgi:hypothetical protein
LAFARRAEAFEDRLRAIDERDADRLFERWAQRRREEFEVPA